MRKIYAFFNNLNSEKPHSGNVCFKRGTALSVPGRYFPRFLGVFWFWLCLGTLVSAAEITLARDFFHPGDKMETILSVSEQGWYSISVESPRGSGLALIDRMSGVLENSGRPGQEDGRMVRLLEAGEYKIKLLPDNDPDNLLQLHAEKFLEQNEQPGGGLPFLPGEELVETALDSGQLRSYWIRLEENEPLALEVMGRGLIACQLWRDGKWLEDLRPRMDTRSPVTGQPMAYYEYYQSPPPGLYLLQCVGGEAREWSEEAEGAPLYIRRGIRNLGEADYREWELSPFGRDGFFVSGQADYFELQRDDKEDTLLVLRSYNDGSSRFSGSSRRAAIKADSAKPWCSISYRYRGEKQLLFMEGKPGDKVRLLFFPRASRHRFREEDNGKKFWISSLSSSGSAYKPDVAALMLSYEGDDNKIEGGVYLSTGRGKPLSRTINLVSNENLFLFVEDDGYYYIREESNAGAAEGEYRLVRYMDNNSARNVPPAAAGERWLLQKGYYAMEIGVRKAGILRFVLYHQRDRSSAADIEGEEFEDPRSNFILREQSVQVDRTRRQYLELLDRRGVSTGLVVREEPVALERPLVFQLPGGEAVDVPVFITGVKILRMEGRQAALFVDERPAGSGFALSPGKHILRLENTGTRPAYYSLLAEAPETLPPSPLVVAAAGGEDYPRLEEGEALFSDYQRNDSHHYLVEVKEPAFYHLETTGRLSMGMTVRTAIDPQLFSAAENGTGRNALVQTYLKPGLYLVETRTLKMSRGRSGLRLKRNPPLEGGLLKENVIYRTPLESSQAVRFRMELDTPLECRLETLGLGKTFNYRLEESGGWPVVVSRSGSFKGLLEEGVYYYYSLPEAYKTRRLTQLTLSASPGPAKEDGPVPLVINKTLHRKWQEKEGRPADVFLLSVPAELPLSLQLNAEMQVEIHRERDGSLLSLNDPDQSAVVWEPGDYRLEVTSREVNNSFNYTIRVATDQLGPGLRQHVSRFPTPLVVNNPSSRIVNLYSSGSLDVKAALYDMDGNRLGENDDAPGDWNFKISRKLAPGKYYLLVEKAGSGNGSTDVSMEMVEEIPLAAAVLPFKYRAETGNSMLKLPFTTGGTPGLCRIESSGEADVALALYRGEKLLAEADNSIHIPLRAGTEYVLHMWHRENREVLIDVSLDMDGVPVVPFRGEKVDLELQPAVEIVNDSRRSFTLNGNTTGLFYSSGMEQPCLPVTYHPLNSYAGRGWLVAAGGGGSRNLSLEPVRLRPGSSRAFLLGKEEQSFGLSYYGSAVLLLQVESPGNRSGVMLAAEADFEASSHDWDGLLLTSRGTLSGVPGKGEFTGKLWDIDGKEGRIPVSLNTLAFPLQAQESLPLGGSAGLSLQPGYGCTFLLEKGNQRLDLLLPRELVAFSWEEGRSQGIVAAETANLATRLDVRGGAVSLVNTGKSPALLRVQSSLLDAKGVQEVRGSVAHESVRDVPEGLRLKIVPAEGKDLLCLAGDYAGVRFGRGDGRLDEGEEMSGMMGLRVFPLRAGTLEIECLSGYLCVWQTTLETMYTDLVNRRGGEPARILTGSGILSGSAQLWDFSLPEDAYIQLDSEASGMTALYAAQKPVAVTAGGNRKGRSLFYYLKKGQYQVYTRPLGDSEQRGHLKLSRLYPVGLEEGESRPTLIGPGENHVYSFRVAAEGKVGIGVKTEMDVLQVQLFDNAFQVLGEGPLLFPVLERGEYYLIVHSREDTVQYSPVVLGSEGSVTGIPGTVIEKYKEGR